MNRFNLIKCTFWIHMFQKICDLTIFKQWAIYLVPDYILKAPYIFLNSSLYNCNNNTFFYWKKIITLWELRPVLLAIRGISHTDNLNLVFWGILFTQCIYRGMCNNFPKSSILACHIKVITLDLLEKIKIYCEISGLCIS